MQKGKLTLLFFSWVGLMLLIVIFNQPDTRPSKLERPGFFVTETAEMYFKNVRSFFYDRSEEGFGDFEVYRIKSRNRSRSNPSLNFAIYNHWRQNLSFIRLDTNNQIYQQADAVILKASPPAKDDTLLLPSSYNEDQYEFAKQIYLCLQERDTILLLNKNKEVYLEIIPGGTGAPVKAVLTDYFRLIGKL